MSLSTGWGQLIVPHPTRLGPGFLFSSPPAWPVPKFPLLSLLPPRPPHPRSNVTSPYNGRGAHFAKLDCV